MLPLTSCLFSRDIAVVMKVLQILVSQHYTVIITLHEPSAEVFRSIDTLLLLNLGSVMYNGPAGAAVQHFTEKANKVRIEIFYQ